MEYLATWSEFFTKVGEYLKPFKPIFEAAAGVGTFWLFVWKSGLKNWCRNKYNHYVASRTARYDLLNLKLDKITGQLYPNGGSSLFDRVVEIKAKQNEIILSVAELKIGQRNSREIMNTATWESDETGRVTYVSAGLCKLLGATEHDLLDDSWTGLLVPEDRDRIVKGWKDSVHSASPFDDIYTYKKSDGYYLRVQGIAIHNKDSNGKVTSSLGRLIPIAEPFKNK